MKITSKQDGGDIVLSGTATVAGRKVTAGERLTAAEQRGGVSLSDAQDNLAGKLGELACRAVRV